MMIDFFILGDHEMTKRITPLKAIRAHCLSCAGRPKEVRLCQSFTCNLFLYRAGTNPARKGVGRGRAVLCSKNGAEKPKTEENQPLNEALREVPLV
jgi:hypothetical protein